MKRVREGFFFHKSVLLQQYFFYRKKKKRNRGIKADNTTEKKNVMERGVFSEVSVGNTGHKIEKQDLMVNIFYPITA